MFETQNKYHKNSCAQLYFQYGPQTDRSNIMLNLIAQVLSEPCYDVLRTKVSEKRYIIKIYEYIIFLLKHLKFKINICIYVLVHRGKYIRALSIEVVGQKST